jgi:hypothetical protein
LNDEAGAAQTKLRAVNAGAIGAHQHDIDLHAKAIRRVIAPLAEAGVLREHVEGYLLDFDGFGTVIQHSFRQHDLELLPSGNRPGLHPGRPQFLDVPQPAQKFGRAAYQYQHRQ